MFKQRSQPEYWPEPGVVRGRFKLLQRKDGLYFVWAVDTQERVTPFVKRELAEGLLETLAALE